MDKKEFYKIQAESFKDYSGKFANRDFLSVFEEWAKSKDFSDEDKQEIWMLAMEKTKR